MDADLVMVKGPSAFKNYSTYKYVLKIGKTSYTTKDLRARYPSDVWDWDDYMVSANEIHQDRTTWSYEINLSNPRIVNVRLSGRSKRQYMETLQADFGEEVLAISEPIVLSEQPNVIKYFVKIQTNQKAWEKNIHSYDDTIPPEYNNIIHMNNKTLEWGLRYAC